MWISAQKKYCIALKNASILNLKLFAPSQQTLINNAQRYFVNSDGFGRKYACHTVDRAKIQGRSSLAQAHKHGQHRTFSSQTESGLPKYIINPNDQDDELRIMIQNHAQLTEKFNKLSSDSMNYCKIQKKIVDILRDIGMYHWNMSNFAASKEATEDALQHLLMLQSSSLFGEDHDIEKELSTLLHFMGNIYAKMAIGNNSHPGRINSGSSTIPQQMVLHHKREALKWFSKSLELKRKYFGDDHAEVGKTLNGMGMLYAPSTRIGEIRKNDEKLGADTEYFEESFDKAKSLFGESIVIFQQEYSEDHPFVASVRENLGRLFMVSGIYKDALNEFSEVLRIKQMYVEMGGLDPNDKALANLYAVMGDCLLDLNSDMEKTLSTYETAVKMLETEERNKKDCTLLATLYHKLGVVHSRMGKLDMALAQYETGLELKKMIGGGDHFEVGITLNCMGAIYGTKGDNSKALSFFREALRIFKINAITEDGVLDTEDINMLNAQSNIGLIQRLHTQ